MRITSLRLLVLPLMLLITTSCAERTAPATGNSGPPAAAAPASVVHVHGLGINPADGVLYAATHTGLFRLPEQGTATRVADRWQDTMGFTIVGPDHFFGSGHPDLREAQAKRLPPLLGLLETRDAGQTWQPRSLLGQSDFHVLRAAHGRVYGYDSTGGGLMVSADGSTWETRAKLSVLDFVVSPTDPELLIAALVKDVQRSRDGGRTWETLQAPRFVKVAWEEPATLWGLTAPGIVFRSADAGESWHQQGTLAGAPAAFVAAGGTLYVAIEQQGIYRSEDTGATWQLYYRDQG